MYRYGFYITRFKGTVLFDEVIGCYVDEENEGSQIFDNEVYSVTEEQLRRWLDEELCISEVMSLKVF